LSELPNDLFHNLRSLLSQERGGFVEEPDVGLINPRGNDRFRHESHPTPEPLSNLLTTYTLVGFMNRQRHRSLGARPVRSRSAQPAFADLLPIFHSRDRRQTRQAGTFAEHGLRHGKQESGSVERGGLAQDGGDCGQDARERLGRDQPLSEVQSDHAG